jgi:hypothetical protein
MKGRAEGGARTSALRGRHSPWIGFGLGQRTFSSPGERLFLRDGVDPEGQRLRPPMPRWQVTDQEVQDLVAYLKTL